MFLLAAAVVLFVGATAYIITIGLHEKLLLPHFFKHESKSCVLILELNYIYFSIAPQIWLHRANVYNNVTNFGLVKINETIRYSKPRLHDSEYKLVCYYMLPSENGKQDGSLETNKLDANLCTHINVAFARVENNSLQLDNVQIKAIQEVVDLKRQNEKLKVLVSVGGAGDDMGFPDMVLDHQNRKTLVSCLFYRLNSN